MLRPLARGIANLLDDPVSQQPVPNFWEVLGRTIGIIGYGRIGREVAARAAGLKCRVLAANRSPVADPAPAETVFPLAEIDRMLPLCDTPAAPDHHR